MAVAMTHHCGNLFLPYISFKKLLILFIIVIIFHFYPFSFLCISLSLLWWCYQAVQITHVLGERVGELAEEAERKGRSRTSLTLQHGTRKRSLRLPRRRRSHRKAQQLAEKRSA